MYLQQQQLQQLSDWLKQTEERIMKMETKTPAKNLEIFKEQIEQHRVNTAFTFHHSHLRSGYKIAFVAYFCFYYANFAIYISQFRSFKMI